MAPHYNLTTEEMAEAFEGLRFTTYEEAIELFGTPDAPGPFKETFDTVMQLNIEQGVADEAWSTKSRSTHRCWWTSSRAHPLGTLHNEAAEAAGEAPPLRLHREWTDARRSIRPAFGVAGRHRVSRLPEPPDRAHARGARVRAAAGTVARGGLVRDRQAAVPALARGHPGAYHSLFTRFEFTHDIYISVQRVAIAFGIAAAMAIPIGILMSSFRVVGAMSEPVIDLIRYLPVPALVPLTVIWLGIGEVSKVALLWMGTFFQLVLLIADDAKRVPHEYVEIAYTLGAKSRQVLRWIILPSMLPSMVDNLRITLGWCWSYVILAEIVAANDGIGHVIWASRRFGKTPEVIAGVLAIGIIGLASDQLIRFVHRRAFRYLR